MAKTIDINKMRTVCKSLKAPTNLAIRPSGSKKGQTYRTVFMRDRDRILYSKSFRRLAGKTQVYLSGNDDHKRTRLTHTLEVAQIAKTIANSLKLDLDLTEAIALGHDIGHTPFGHAGERILHEIMTPCSIDKEIVHKSPFTGISNTSAYDNFLGFKHNLQSVNVALYLEKDYDEYGLDITNFTLYGMNIHSSAIYKKGENTDKLKYYEQFSQFMKLRDSSFDAWSFEAFVVKEADEIAQRHHDLEDAIRGELISKEEVIKQIKKLFSVYLTPNDRGLLRTMRDTHDNEMYISLLSRLIVNLFVTQITKCSIYNLNKFIIENSLNEQNFPQYMLNHTAANVKDIIAYDRIGTGNTFKDNMKLFESFLTTKVLTSYDIQTADAHGQYVIRKLFQAYYCTPAQLPDHCIIEYCKLTKKYTNSEIKDIITETGMGELRSRFTNTLINNANKEDQMYLMRVICNQIAGMTDTFAQRTFNDLYS